MAAILEDGGITDDPFAWDPLRDLKIQGPQALARGWKGVTWRMEGDLGFDFLFVFLFC